MRLEGVHIHGKKNQDTYTCLHIVDNSIAHHSVGIMLTYVRIPSILVLLEIQCMDTDEDLGICEH